MAQGGRSFYDEDLTTCALCMETYKDPRALPCLHSFCYGCLEDLLPNDKEKLGKSNTIKCPLCQEEHELGAKGLSGFRKNFNIQSLIDRMETNTKKLNKVDHLGENSNPTKIVEYCWEHRNKIALYYCQDTKCSKVICESCWLNEHENHPVILLSKWMNNYKATLQHDIDRYEGYLTYRVTETLNVKELVEKLEGKIQKMLKGINDEKQKIRRENTTLLLQREQFSVLHVALEDANHLQEAMAVKEKVEKLKESVKYSTSEYLCKELRPEIDELVKLFHITVETIAQSENHEAIQICMEAKHENTYYFPKKNSILSACMRIMQPNQLFVANEDKIVSYNLDDGSDTFYYPTEVGTKIGWIGMLMIGNVEHMVKFDKKNQELRFYSSKNYNDIPFDALQGTYTLPDGCMPFHFTCADNSIAFSFMGRRDPSMIIGLLNVESLPPTNISKFGSKLLKHDAICLMKNEKSYLLAVGAKWSDKGLYSTAIRAFNKEGKKQWDIPWKAFVQKSSYSPSLEYIATDSKIFFVLYNVYSRKSWKETIYTISKDGQVLQKLLDNLDSCQHLMVSQHLQKLCVINRKTVYGPSSSYKRSDCLMPLPVKEKSKDSKGDWMEYGTNILKIYEITEQASVAK